MDDRERIVLQGRAIDALRQRIVADSYLDTTAVCERLNIGPASVRAIPMEVLPYTPYGQGTREYRRYHPADVLAADARIRAWRKAQQTGEERALLEEWRAELQAADALAIQIARDSRRTIHAA